MTRTAALVLAGGASRRMGVGDKPLLALGDTTMLARILAVVQPDAVATAISANGDPARFAALGLPVLPDAGFAGQGPLAGVLAGLDWAAGLGADCLLTVPGDTPFIPPGLAGALSPAPACAASNGRTHHLIALWPVACRDALRAMLSEQGSRAVARFTDRIGMRVVDFPAQPCDPFVNINTPEELEAAQALVRQAGKQE
jgi:molybdopterin-guanine dinucleotide biosynthesis protein A